MPAMPVGTAMGMLYVPAPPLTPPLPASSPVLSGVAGLLPATTVWRLWVARVEDALRVWDFVEVEPLETTTLMPLLLVLDCWALMASDAEPGPVQWAVGWVNSPSWLPVKT